jgi:gas vesicle structural protein
MKPLRLMIVRDIISETQMVDLLDHILDKGIVIDAWARVTLVGIDLGIWWEARMVVASIDTYIKYGGPIGLLHSVAWPRPTALKQKASSLLSLPNKSREVSISAKIAR